MPAPAGQNDADELAANAKALDRRKWPCRSCRCFSVRQLLMKR